MTLHVGHNCSPLEKCGVCGADIEPQYRARKFKIVPDSSWSQVWNGDLHVATFRSHSDAVSFVDGAFSHNNQALKVFLLAEKALRMCRAALGAPWVIGSPQDQALLEIEGALRVIAKARGQV